MNQSKALPGSLQTRIHVIEVAGMQLFLRAPQNPDELLSDPQVEMRYKADNYMPYWPIIWPSGLMLAARILTDSQTPPGLPDLKDACAIELGCGLGTAGIAAAKRGWRVTFTDYDAQAVEYARHNAILNGIPQELVGGMVMDWREPVGEKFHWIIASDVLYERRLHPLLLGAIEHFMAPDGCAWVSDPKRNSAEDFPLEAVTAGFQITEIPLSRCEGGALRQDGNLYVLRRAEKIF